MKKMLLYFSLLCACVSCRTDVIGGSVNETNRVDMTTYEWLLQEETTAVVGQDRECQGQEGQPRGGLLQGVSDTPVGCTI